jgi:DNA-directed RNA polymerase specialized sigma24 family protein
MGTSGPNRRRSFDLGEVAPFWLPPADADGRVINDLVRDAARELWPWAFRHVQKELRDGARALEIVQEVAAEASGRLKDDAEVGRNLKGYFTTAFIHCVRNHVLHESRIEYEGLIRELEENHHPRAPDWIRGFETALSLKLLAAYMSAPMRRMLNYRLSDYSWKEIGVVFNMTDRQVRSRFYYGARKAYEDLLSAQAERQRSKEAKPWT